MITKIEIDGFKSLQGFELTLKKGLNVLIGPNGVGKTNICQTLNLLSSIATEDLPETLLSMGGADAVFSKEPETRVIVIKVSGFAQGLLKSSKKKEDYDVEYHYEATISLKDQKIELDDHLSLRRRNNDIEKGEYISIMEVESKGAQMRYEIKNSKLVGDFKLPIKKGVRIEREQDDSLWTLMPRVSFSCHLVWRDLLRIKTINIDPYIARQACDIVEPDEMKSNGKYLSNALYELANDKEKLGEINSILNQTLPFEGSIEPRYDHRMLKRFFSFKTDSNQEFSSHSLSDGTIKLLGLLVGIEDSENFTMIVEEPENYLHPQAQQLIIEFLREMFDDRVCLITSHSETILNNILPNEIIICGQQNGQTKCLRVEDQIELNESLASSGFGCGYHVVAGNLSYRDNF